MKLNITYRQAEEKDIPFLIETITHAEKSGTDKFSYVTLFEMQEEEVVARLNDILLEDMTGQELCISGFIIAEVDGEYAGACCSWIEGESGQSSAIIKANLLAYYFGAEHCMKAAEKSSVINSIHFTREKGALQIESSYVRDKYKGLGINGEMMLQQIHLAEQQHKSFHKIQVIVVGDNKQALNAHNKIGLNVVDEKCCQDARVTQWLPGSCMYLMEACPKKDILKKKN